MRPDDSRPGADADPASGDHPPGAAGAQARVVTISASYGSGGSVIAPRLAEHLGLPFVDRLLRRELAVGASHASELEGHSREHLTEDEAGAVVGNRLLDYLAHAATVGVMPIGAEAFDDDAALRDHAEAPCLAATSRGGVILGRAAAVVLSEVACAYHVRLDGPAQRRRLRAAVMEGISPAEAAERQTHTDRARELWVKRLYRADVKDPGWYHMVLDTTVLGPDDAVEVVAGAAARYWARLEPDR